MTENTELHVYECFYKEHRATVRAMTTYAAQKEYAQLHNVKEKQRYKISVYLVRLSLLINPVRQIELYIGDDGKIYQG